MTLALFSGTVSTDQAALLVLMGLGFSALSLWRGYTLGWTARDNRGRLNRSERRRIPSHDVSPRERN